MIGVVYSLVAALRSVPGCVSRRVRTGVRVLTTLGLIALLCHAVLELSIRLAPLPAPAPPPRPAVWLDDAGGVPLAAFVSDSDEWHLPLTYEQISPHLVHAIIAVEDRRFLDHHGVDVRAALTACAQNARSMRVVRGASTLTMQLIRLRDPRARSWSWKFEQAFRARQLELVAGKTAIITEYLNRAPFGGNLVGAGAASWRYFGKPCRELSLGEAALLAGLPQNPNRFRPDRSAGYASRRRDYVLDRMLATGQITAQQSQEARREPLEVRWRPLPQHTDAGAAAAVPTLAAVAANSQAGISRTTLLAPLQRQAAALAREHLAQLKPSGISAAALIVLDTQTADTRAAVSLSADAPDLDLTRTARSTGSILKPFIYAAAFETGRFDRTSVLDDSPASWAGYAPLNFDKTFRGPMLAGDALAESRNIPAMTLLAHIGIERTAGLIESLGVRSLRRPGRPVGLALAIGGAEATPAEIAEAYATLARGGLSRPVHVRPGDRDSSRRSTPLLAPSACREVLACLSDAERTARVSPEAARLRPAWKTGTSSGFRDAWCAAVTPRYTVVAWFGNATGRGSSAIVGADAAAPLALRTLAAIDTGVDAPPLDVAARPESPVSPAPVTRRAPLAILTPMPGQELILHADEPATRQRIALTATGGSGATRWWFVDGAMIRTAAAAETVWWIPTGGSHNVRVVDATGQAASVMIAITLDGTR